MKRALVGGGSGDTDTAIFRCLAASGRHVIVDPVPIERLVPMRRAGTPDEVAALVAFRMSEDAGHLSGRVISVNGAMA